jgi:hypothetical protein
MTKSSIAALVLCFAAVMACGQSTKAKPGSFWTRERKIETVVYIGSTAIDDYSTQLDRQRSGVSFVEYDPMTRPFYTRGIGYQALGASIELTGAVLPSYLLHRLHHEKASRWWLRISTGGEAVSAGRMLYLFH